MWIRDISAILAMALSGRDSTDAGCMYGDPAKRNGQSYSLGIVKRTAEWVCKQRKSISPCQ